jgi:hypothetical protein
MTLANDTLKDADLSILEADDEFKFRTGCIIAN